MEMLNAESAASENLGCQWRASEHKQYLTFIKSCKPSQGQKQVAIRDEWSPEPCNPGIFDLARDASSASASLDVA